MRLLLLRHGEVASHRGDVPITPHGFERARETGRRLGSELTGPEPMRLLSADTLRARQTIDAIYQGAVESAGEDRVLAPRVAFALRNPDLYLAGQRVDMVSTATALAEQVEGLDEDGCAEVPFFAGFLSAPERVGFWVTHASPPGEDPAAVAGRVTAFAASLSAFPCQSVPPRPWPGGLAAAARRARQPERDRAGCGAEPSCGLAGCNAKACLDASYPVEPVPTKGGS